MSGSEYLLCYTSICRRNNIKLASNGIKPEASQPLVTHKILRCNYFGSHKILQTYPGFEEDLEMVHAPLAYGTIRLV